MSTEIRFLPLPPDGRVTPRYAQAWMEEKAAEWVRLLEAGYLVRDPEVRGALLFLASDVGHMLDACNEALARGLAVDVEREHAADEEPEELPELVAALLALDPDEIEPAYPALRTLAARVAERDATLRSERGEARRHIARRIGEYLAGAPGDGEMFDALALRLERVSPHRVAEALRAALDAAEAPEATEPADARTAEAERAWEGA